MRTRIANQPQVVAKGERKAIAGSKRSQLGGPNSKQSLTGRVRILSSPFRAGLAQKPRNLQPVDHIRSPKPGTDAAIGASPIQLCFGKGRHGCRGEGICGILQSRNVHASGVAACLTLGRSAPLVLAISELCVLASYYTE